MNNGFFSINNFSIIEDDENYYFFRSLEPYDINNGKESKLASISNGNISLRTNRERYNETHDIPSRYSDSESISLDEVYSHIKKNFYPGTNCISFSSNCNVSLDYGTDVNKYVMIKVPKNDSSDVYSGGQYMLEQLDKNLENVISKIVNQTEIIPVIRNLEQVDSSDKIIKIIQEQISNYDYRENSENLISRFLPKQFFNPQQQLAYNKVIGKLTLLELSGNVENVLSRTNGNSSLLSTISMAYSSGEIIKYGNDFKNDELSEVSKTIVNLFALLQQAEDMGFDNNKISKLKVRVLDCAKQGFELKMYNNVLGFGNDARYIPFNPSLNSILINEDRFPLDKEILIDDTFKLTDGRIPYAKAKHAVEFALNLGLAKEKTYELCELLKTISVDLQMDDIIDEIATSCYSINSKIINRRNNSGLKICESVNIDMNSTREKSYSDDEQSRMISYISRMSRDNLRLLLRSSGLSIEKNLCERILSADSKRDINRYYAETIVDDIDFISIYGDNRVITDDDRELLISKLEQANCVNLYNSLKNSEISSELISGYIINFLMDDGFKDYNFIELSKLNDLKNLLKANKQNLNYRIPAIRLDKVFGIQDNNNYIGETGINLRDYQQDAVNNIDSLFDEKRFAGVILPTGAGKSFVAMAEMLKYRNKNILYYAPNTEILNQITKHIMKNILHLSSETIQRLYDEKTPVLNGRFLPANIETIINEAFPHLKLYCYQGLTTKDDDFFNSHDADLIIFDEIHRAGATEWNNKIKKLVKSNPNAKLLGITATPIRDVDRQDMMLKFAELSGDYSKKELLQKRYLSSEMYLIDAMQEGIVVIPNLVSFDYTLEDSDQYKEVKALYENEKNPAEKARIKTIYDEMRQIVENSKKIGMSKIIKDSFEKNNKKSNGRYIVFLPLKSNSGMTTEEYIKNEIEKVKEYFSLIDNEPEIGYLLSNREKPSENSIAMSNFEKDSNHLKLIFAINMLNEGVHVDGIDGIMMLRPIGANTRILYSQQTGRCVYALDPDKPLKDGETPLIFDVYNNYLEQNMDREVNKSNSTSDLQKMRHAVYWIRKHRGYFPDINSDDSNEYRKAATLKKIQAKYSKYLTETFSDNLNPTEQYEIEEILLLGRSINLWDVMIPNREKKQINEISIDRINAFKATAETKRFLELYKSAKENNKSKIKVGALRIRTAISVLELLSEYGIDISEETIPINTLLKDVIKKIPTEVLDIVKSELDELQISEDYPIGEEYFYVGEMFCSNNPTYLEFSIRTLRNAGIFQSRYGKFAISSRGFIINGRKEYRNINIYTGSYYDTEGLDISGYDELYFRSGGGTYNKYGFDRNYIHYKTKTKLNEHGFDIYRNYHVLKPDGTYENKGKYDDYGFDIDELWYEKKINPKTGEINWVYTGRKTDPDGYNIDGIKENGFGRDDFYYKKRDDVYVNTGKKTDPFGFDCNSIHYKTKTKFDEHGFTQNRKHLNGTYVDEHNFKIDGVNEETNLKYSKKYFDIDGYYWEQRSDGIRVKTNRKWNERGFDIDDYYWKLQSDGTRVKTDEKYNEHGFNSKQIHKITMTLFDEYGKNEQGELIMNSEEFYDSDGYYWKKQSDGKYKNTLLKYDFDGFDADNYYWKLQSDGTRVKTDRSYNEKGFKKNKYNVYTGELFDEDGRDMNGSTNYSTKYLDSSGGFDTNGYYWKKQSDGTYRKTKNRWDDRGFKANKINRFTNLPVDQRGLDINNSTEYLDSTGGFDPNGQYWKKQPNGIYIATGKFWDDRGFKANKINRFTNLPVDQRGLDINNSTKYLDSSGGFDTNGYYWKKQPDGTYRKTFSKINEQGLNKDDILSGDKNDLVKKSEEMKKKNKQVTEHKIDREIKIENLVEMIKKGITLTNGNHRKFDLLDYYQVTNIPLVELPKIAKDKVSKSDFRFLLYFINQNKNDYNIDGSFLKKIYDEKYVVDVELDENNRPIFGTGREITKGEKQDIVMYLSRNRIPLTKRTYSIAMRRYIDGELIMNKNDPQNNIDILKS